MGDRPWWTKVPKGTPADVKMHQDERGTWVPAFAEPMEEAAGFPVDVASCGPDDDE